MTHSYDSGSRTKVSHDNSGASQMPSRPLAILVQTSNAIVPGRARDCK